jgi:hypothetical protein
MADTTRRRKGGGEGGDLRTLELESRGQKVVVDGKQLVVQVKVLDLAQRHAPHPHI